MGKLTEELVRKKQFLESLIIKAEKKKEKVEGSLRLSHNKVGMSYYQHFPQVGKEKIKDRYIRKSEHGLIKKLAQQDYTNKFLAEAKEELALIDLMLSQYKEERLEKIYSDLHPERKKYVEPYIQDVQECAEQWNNAKYPPGRFNPGLPVIVSNRGERVRSKSEKIIADEYYRLGIPYRYEFPIKFSENGRVIEKRPDFSIFHETRKKVYYHEHLGRMDDPQYVRDNLDKLELYNRHGIYLGENLILTFETSDKPFDSVQLDQFIAHYFSDYIR